MGLLGALNEIAVLMLISPLCFKVQQVSAEMCRPPLASDRLCKEWCSLGHSAGSMLKHSNQPTWAVSTNPYGLLPQVTNGKPRPRKTFTWRRVEVGQPGGPNTQQVCTIQCNPITPKTNNKRPRIPKRLNWSDSNYLSIPKKGGASQNKPKMQDFPELQCSPGNLFIMKDETDSMSETPSKDLRLNRNILNATATCGTKFEGVSPGCVALNCIATLQPTSEGKGNVNALTDSMYSPGSIRIRYPDNDKHKMELTPDQMKQLTDYFTFEHKNSKQSDHNPLVVQVENTTSNKSSKFAIVKMIDNNIMVGIPYKEVYEPQRPPQRTVVGGHGIRNSFAPIEHPFTPMQGDLMGGESLAPMEPQALVAPPPLQWRPELPVFTPHTPQGMLWSQDRPPITEYDLVDSCQTGQMNENVAYHNRPFTCSHCCSNTHTPFPASWITREMLPEKDTADGHADDFLKPHNPKYEQHLPLGNPDQCTVGYPYTHKSSTNYKSREPRTFRRYMRSASPQLSQIPDDTAVTPGHPTSGQLQPPVHPRYRTSFYPYFTTPRKQAVPRPWPERVKPVNVSTYVTEPPRKYIAPPGKSYTDPPLIFAPDQELRIWEGSSSRVNHFNTQHQLRKQNVHEQADPKFNVIESVPPGYSLPAGNSSK